MIDMVGTVWKDRQTQETFIIFGLTEFMQEDLVWFQDIETAETHCMSVDMFVTRYKAHGVFEDAEQIH